LTAALSKRRIGMLFCDYRPAAGEVGRLFDTISTAAAAADRAGLYSVSVMDHVHSHPPYWDRNDPVLEAWVLLGALAARTSHVRLGTLVSGVTYRNPALLAKMVTALDIVSGGRAFLGLGASWLEDEYLAYGFGEALPPIEERIDRLREALEICIPMLQGKPSVFAGDHYKTAGALNVPPPVQIGGPPILVGGGGERRTLRVVAQYADIANFFGDAATVRHKLKVLDSHCEAIGRDPREVSRSHTRMAILAPSLEEAERRATTVAARGGQCIAGDPPRLAEQIDELYEIGIDEVMLFTDHLWNESDVTLLADVARRVSAASLVQP
jgi:F420-dependent oxidoreductase-like protein